MEEHTFVEGLEDGVKRIPVKDIETGEKKALLIGVTYYKDSIVRVEGKDLKGYETPDEAIMKAVEKKGMEVLPGCWWAFQNFPTEVGNRGFVMYECCNCAKAITHSYEGLLEHTEYKYCPYCGEKIEGFLDASGTVFLSVLKNIM